MKYIIDDNFNTLGNHLQNVLHKLEEDQHWYGDPEAPDLGIWDPRFNIKKKNSMIKKRSKAHLKQDLNTISINLTDQDKPLEEQSGHSTQKSVVPS